VRQIATLPAPSPLDLLGGDPGAPAVRTADEELTRADLRERVRERRDELGDVRRLVMVSCANAVEPLVTYLAAREGGHPVLLVPGDPAQESNRRALLERYDPDVVFGPGEHGWALDERRDGTRHELHPELAMLASTSGSTGAPKLVRLSHDNLLSNAASIADYLGLRPDDRAATTLPMQYCYGLSVINSHLLVGASLFLTERSVVEPRFWSEFDEAEATSFAGVPYTFELLDATGFAERTPPRLRTVTQAGGRLGADRVRRYASLGQERGFDFVVMYGQTEATARMAYLPPELADARPTSIGIPIPGGRFRIDESVGNGEAGVGELVYSGPNVMMGYAEAAEDFAAGATLEELRTGDLARRADDGLYEVVGRGSRFVKVFGLRIDLDRVEQLMLEHGIDARAIGHDERLVVFVLSDREGRNAAGIIAASVGLPPHSVRVHPIAEFPRTPNGKSDTAALVRHADLLERDAQPEDASGATSVDRVRELYAELIGRPDAGPDDSFVTLGGDSLSYVEVSLRLERLLGDLPQDWPSRTIRELAFVEGPGDVADVADVAKPRPRWRTRFAMVETSVVLRTAAILLIVATHADLIALKGGAHLLLGVAGFNLARFKLTDVPRSDRVRGLARGAAQLVVPAVLWIGGVALIAGSYDPATVLLANNAFGQHERWGEQWQFWFLEALIWAIVALALLLLVPRLDALERRHGFAVALAVLGATLALRFTVAGGVTAESPDRYALPVVVWLIALGWLIARATTTAQRILATCLVVATIPGFFGDPAREAVIAVGLVLLLWVRAMPVPAMIAGVVGAIASASMFVYLTHWQVYPPIEEVSPALAVVASFAVGLLAWRGYGVLARRAGAVRLAAVRRLRRP